MASSNPPFYLSLSLFFLTLYLPSSKYRRLLFTAILGLVLRADLELLYGPPRHCPSPLRSDFILLTPDPHHTLQRRPKRQLPREVPKTRKERLVWALDLFSNPRGINWSFEAPNLTRPCQPRWAFVRSQLLWAVVFYVMKDAMYTHNRLNSSFDPTGHGMDADGWGWRMWNAVAFWGTFASGMSLDMTMMAIVCVASGISEPEPGDCPWFFGRWLETTSVRAFWGRTWHQTLRRGLSSHGKYLAHILFHFPPWITSFLVHPARRCLLPFGTRPRRSEWMLSHNLTAALHVVLFYAAQALAIMFEDGVIACGKGLGVRGSRGVNVLGMLWVIFWMAWSGPWWMNPTIRGGVMIAEGPRISVIGGLWDGNWSGIAA
ncbi:hypothetical protein FPV67DRAFT_1674916 [Lyophyllum atratum]|nr:hypothetical protein FPV67DRAFT_1674916 [Lyophyllum atratum]